MVIFINYSFLVVLKIFGSVRDNLSLILKLRNILFCKILALSSI